MSSWMHFVAKAMMNDPQFSSHRLLLCSLCGEISKSDPSVEKWVSVLITNSKATISNFWPWNCMQNWDFWPQNLRVPFNPLFYIETLLFFTISLKSSDQVLFKVLFHIWPLRFSRLVFWEGLMITPMGKSPDVCVFLMTAGRYTCSSVIIVLCVDMLWAFRCR